MAQNLDDKNDKAPKGHSRRDMFKLAGAASALGKRFRAGARRADTCTAPRGPRNADRRRGGHPRSLLRPADSQRRKRTRCQRSPRRALYRPRAWRRAGIGARNLPVWPDGAGCPCTRVQGRALQRAGCAKPGRGVDRYREVGSRPSSAWCASTRFRAHSAIPIMAAMPALSAGTCSPIRASGCPCRNRMKR